MKLKKLICVFLCCVMVLGINVNVFAAVDTYETEEVYNVEYIKFVSNPLARMNSYGTFEFQFTSRVISDKFTVTPLFLISRACSCCFFAVSHKLSNVSFLSKENPEKLVLKVYSLK